MTKTADYDTDYEKPLGPYNLTSLPQKLNFLLYDDRYRRCQLFSPIPITTDTSNNRPDYEYYRCIRTALLSTPAVLNLWPDDLPGLGWDLQKFLNKVARL